MTKSNFTRRGLLRTGAAGSAGLALPTIFTGASWAQTSGFTNAPQGDTVTLEALPEEIKSPAYFDDISVDGHAEQPSNLKSVSKVAEREAILSVLEKTGYNKTKAANVLNIDRKTLYNKMKSYNIDL